MCCFVRLRSLSADSYVVKSIPLTHLIARASSAHKYARAFQCIPFASMNNIDSSEGDFALLLLAEKQAAISKKIGEPTNV